MAERAKHGEVAKDGNKGISKDVDKFEVSKAKARRFLADAQDLGWEHSGHTENDETGEFRLTVVREDEAIEIGWINGSCDPYIPYTHAGRQIKLRNASAARKRMASPPDAIAPRRSRFKSRDGNDNSTGEGRAARVVRRYVPFDPEESLDEEVLQAVIGKRLIWVNSITGLHEESMVMNKAKQRHLKIENGAAGRRILTFCSGTEGFRSVALESILRVG